MSPVAADCASADNARTDDPVVVPEVIVADAAGCCAELLLELDDPDDPQAAADAARSAEASQIAARTMAGILQARPENVLNACARSRASVRGCRILTPR